MRKNKVRVLLSMLMCLCVINMGSMFSYAGGSSGGSGSGYVSPKPPDLLLKKVWQPDENGNYGPAKGRSVNITATLSFNVNINEGGTEKTLNFRMSRTATTKPIESFEPQILPWWIKKSEVMPAPIPVPKSEPANGPKHESMPGPRPNNPEEVKDEYKNLEIAFISFMNGNVEIKNAKKNEPSLLNITKIETKSKDGKEYTCQFITNDLLVNPKTREAAIGKLKVCETPKSKTPKQNADGRGNGPGLPIDEEQLSPDNAYEIENVKAMLTFEEEKINDYESTISIDELRPPMPPKPNYPPGGSPKVVLAPNGDPDGKVPVSPMPPNDFDIDYYNYVPLDSLKATVINTYNPKKPPVPPEEPPVPPEEPPAPPEEKVTKPTPPRTGDMDNLGLIFSLLSVSIGATVFAIKKKNS